MKFDGKVCLDRLQLCTVSAFWLKPFRHATQRLILSYGKGFVFDHISYRLQMSKIFSDYATSLEKLKLSLKFVYF